MKFRRLLALILFSLLTFSPVKAIRSDFAAQPLRVAAMPITPFVIRDGNQLRGYDVDVWEQIAQRLNLKYEWVLYDTIDEVLQSVKENRLDAAIAAISMTPDRDLYLDFTYPYFDSGLQIMLRQRPRVSFFQGIRLVSTPFLVEIILLGLLAGLLMAHLIWLVERRSNPSFPRGYFLGVWEGLWWLLQIIASGCYRDLETKSVIKRLMTVVFWIMGVAIVAEFTATLTTALTVHQLTPTISDPTDLPGYRIATVNHTTAAEYLSQHQLDFVGVDQIEAAYTLLLDDDVDAIVFDAPVLLYYAAHQGNLKVTVPGNIFRLEKYAIAIPTDDRLRDEINLVLLQMYQDGTLEALQKKWFGNP